MIVLAANTTSSLIQPLFGYLADKTARRWLLPLSVLLSAVGLGFIGLAPSYGTVLALVVITGFGVAAYHPEGYRTATAVAGDRKATGVSIFSTGGNIGLATSGSGDTLAGVVGGLLARGADPVAAGAWAAYLHGEAGNRLQRRHGLIGFIARELLGEIPGLMGELSG